MPEITSIVLPLFTAFLVTVIITPLSIYFLKRVKLLDDPKIHKHPAMLHTKPIPRGGGIPLFIGILLAGLIFLPHTRITIGLLLASFLALTIGTIDDKFDISRYFRFITNILCAMIVIISGVHIPFITNPFGGVIRFDQIGGGLLADGLAVIWIVWVMNALNWSKGVDGQMPGIVAISAFVIGLLSLRFSLADPSTFVAATLAFIITGASLGFLIFNFYPAKIFPGYGATAVYLLLSVVSILSTAKLATAILVMGVPMVDGAFTIARRLFTGRSPFWHDKKHLHHLLLQLGFGQRRIALFYWIVSAILGAIALTLTSKQKIFAIIMLVVVIGMIILFLQITLRDRHEKNKTI